MHLPHYNSSLRQNSCYFHSKNIIDTSFASLKGFIPRPCFMYLIQCWPHLMKLGGGGNLSFPRVMQFVKIKFQQQNAIKGHMWGSLKLSTFKCFDVSIFMWDKLGEYWSEDTIWVMAQHEVSKSSQFKLRATIYLGPDWGPRTLIIWASRIARFHQIRPKGFILGAGPNTHSSHVVF